MHNHTEICSFGVRLLKIQLHNVTMSKQSLPSSIILSIAIIAADYFIDQTYVAGENSIER